MPLRTLFSTLIVLREGGGKSRRRMTLPLGSDVTERSKKDFAWEILIFNFPLLHTSFPFPPSESAFSWTNFFYAHFIVAA